MEFDQLRAFLAILDQGSFSRAGRALKLSQSTVSFHIKALETAVGTQVLERSTVARPTAAGKTLRRYAQRILQLRDEALGHLRKEQDGQSGQVVIAASSIPASHLLPGAIAEFRRRHPGIAVTLSASDSRQAVSSLLAQECDLAVVGARIYDKRIDWTPWGSDQVVLVAGARSPWARLRGPLRAADLAGLPLVLREDGSGTRHAVAHLLGRHPPHSTEAAPLVVGSNEAARRCVLAGLGCAFLSSLAVADDVRARRMVTLAVAGAGGRRRFYVARLRSSTPSPAARAFLRVLGRERRRADSVLPRA